MTPPHRSFRQAWVFVRGRKAGELAETPDGFVFTYDSGYLQAYDARPVSFSLPLRLEPYISPTLFSFFAGLLPEGWLLKTISQTSQIDEEDQFGLLLHVGKDPVGAVSVVPPGEGIAT